MQIKKAVSAGIYSSVIFAAAIGFTACGMNNNESVQPTQQESLDQHGNDDSSDSGAESANETKEETVNTESQPDSDFSIYDDFLADYSEFLSGNRAVSDEEEAGTGSIYLGLRGSDGYFMYGEAADYFEQEEDDSGRLHVKYALTDLNNDGVPELVIEHDFMGTKTTVFKAGDKDLEVLVYSSMHGSIGIYENNMIGEFSSTAQSSNFYVLDSEGTLQSVEEPAAQPAEKELIWHDISDRVIQTNETSVKPVEFYRSITGGEVTNAYDEDAAYSLTWNPDGSSEYDTFLVTLYRYDYTDENIHRRADIVINGETHEMDFEGGGSIYNIFVTDINKSDNYKNIIFAQRGDGWDYKLHVYAYKGTELIKIKTIGGELLTSSIDGEGMFKTILRCTWRAGDNDCIVYRETYAINGSELSIVNQEAGVLENNEEGADPTFVEGYLVEALQSISVYEDTEQNIFSGTLEPGSAFYITGYLDGCLKIKGDSIEGYASFSSVEALENYFSFG